MSKLTLESNCCNSCPECRGCGRDRRIHVEYVCSCCGGEYNSDDDIYDVGDDYICADCLVDWLLDSGAISRIKDYE